MGVVRAAQRTSSNDDVAIKVISGSTNNDEKLLAEVRNHRRMNHPHVIKVHEVIERKSNMYIVMELVTGGDLFDYTVKSQPRLPEREARRIFQQIVAGVEHIHGRGVVHRDLKLENIFMDTDGNAKIGDFGLSAEWRAGEVLTDSCGSPNYAAPELLQRACQYEGPEVDVCSLGVILYALLCNSFPFDEPEIPQLFKRIKSGRYAVPGFLPQEAKDLIGRMLDVDRASRARIPAIQNNSWFQKDLPPELSEKKVVALPKLLQESLAKIGSDKTMNHARLASKRLTTSSTHACLEATILAERGHTLQRCGTTPTLAFASTSSTPSAPEVDDQHNSLYGHAGYPVEAALYIFASQFAF